MKFKLVTMDGKRKAVLKPDEAEEARAAVAMAIDEAAWKEEDGEEAKSNESEEQNQKPAAKSNDEEESEDESEEDEEEHPLVRLASEFAETWEDEEDEQHLHNDITKRGSTRNKGTRQSSEVFEIEDDTEDEESMCPSVEAPDVADYIAANTERLKQMDTVKKTVVHLSLTTTKWNSGPMTKEGSVAISGVRRRCVPIMKCTLPISTSKPKVMNHMFIPQQR